MQKKKNPSAFIRNTYNILERPGFDHIIAWNQQGNGFIIHDLPKFQSQILPQYFKHQKYTSFVRQLNMYGFHKQRHPLSENYFLHETFQKGQRYRSVQISLSQIKRKPQKKKKNEQQIPQSKKMINQQEPKSKNGLHSSEQIQSYGIINPEGDQDQGEIEKNESSPSEEIQIKNSDNSIGSLCEKAILQNQILVKVHSFLMPAMLNAKKQRLQLLQQSNRLGTQNLETKHEATVNQTLSFICQVLKTQTMKLYSVLDSSN